MVETGTGEGTAKDVLLGSKSPFLG